MKTQAAFVLLSGLLGTTLAVCKTSVSTTAGEWQQCGGTNYKGPSTCSSGLKCYCQSEYYSQCLATDPGWTGCSNSKASSPQPSSTPLSGTFATNPSSSKSQPQNPKKAAPAPVKSSPKSSPAASAPTSSAGDTSIKPGTCAAYSGSKSGYATTTHYYDGQKGACGCGTGSTMSSWQSSPGPQLFTAAGSQNLFDTGSSSWCGSGCGKCYKLTNVGAIAASGQGTCTGAGESITVMVTNLCPAEGNAQWCSQPSNQYGYGAHFDIMSQDGPEGWNNPVVKYEEVSCPGSLTSNFKTCQCATGGATSRVRRGLVEA